MFEGYSPLAKGQVLSDPVVLQIAKKHGQTAAQICIRWSIQALALSHCCNGWCLSACLITKVIFSQKGVVTIPKSIKKKRIEENCQVSYELVVFSLINVNTLRQDTVRMDQG